MGNKRQSYGNRPKVTQPNDILKKSPGVRCCFRLLLQVTKDGMNVVNEPKVGCHIVNELEIS